MLSESPGNQNLSPKNYSSASVIGRCNDLLEDILLRLPVKSLLVCKSVSKLWLSLISDPYFVENYYVRNRAPVGLFLHKMFSLVRPEFVFIFLDENPNSDHHFVPLKTLNFVIDPAAITIQQSCNGLLCCSSFRPTNNNNCNYYIFNASTKHYKTLTQSQFRTKPSFVRVCSVSLAFDPLKSPHYEAICVWVNDEDDYQIEIYSSETSSWRVSGNPFWAPEGMFSKSGVFWNGSLHWIGIRGCPLYFDIDRELVKTMPMPQILDGWDSRRVAYFGECRGHLHLINRYTGQRNTGYDILELEIDYTGWNVKYHIDLEQLIDKYPLIRYDSDSDGSIWDEYGDLDESSVLLVEEKEEESSKLLMHISNKVISYDLKEMSFKEIQDLPSAHRLDGSLWYRWNDTYQYIESLASV